MEPKSTLLTLLKSKLSLEGDNSRMLVTYIKRIIFLYFFISYVLHQPISKLDLYSNMSQKKESLFNKQCENRAYLYVKKLIQNADMT